MVQLGRDVSTFEPELYPTLGAISMANSMEAMRQRFRFLPYAERDVLHAMKILFLAGGISATISRVRLVISSLLRRDSIELADALSHLEDGGFLKSPHLHEDRIYPEIGYLSAVVAESKTSLSEHERLTLIREFEGARDIHALIHVAWSFHVQHRHDDEISLYGKILELDPLNVDAWNNLGLALGDKGDNDKGLVALETGLTINPARPEVWSNKGVTLRAIGRLKEAVESFDDALAIDPDFIPALSGKGITLAALGDIAGSAEAYKDALRKSMPLSSEWLRYCSFLHRQSRFSEEVQLLEVMILVAADDGDLWFRKAVAEMHLNDINGAVLSARKGVEVAPFNPTWPLRMGEVLLQANLLEEALQAIDQGIELSPSDGRLWALRGQDLFRQGAMHRGTTYDTQGRLVTAPSSAKLGSGETEIKLYESALEAYDKAIALADGPLDPMLCMWKGGLLGILGKSAAQQAEWLCKAWHGRLTLGEANAGLVEASLRALGFEADGCSSTP